MIHVYKNSIQQPKLASVEGLETGSWMYAHDLTDQEIRHLSELLDISVDTIQDSLDVHELPRIKVENDSTILLIRTPVNEDGVYKTVPLTIILHKKYVVTISPRTINVTEDIANRVVKTITTQKSNFLITASLRAIHYYQRYITIINRNIQRDRSNLKAINQHDVLELIETEEILNNFVASLSPTIATLKKLVHFKYINLYEQDKALIDDLLADSEQVLETCNTNLKTIHNIRDGYSTVMTIRLNETMKLLTYLTAAFTIPLIVASVYGMNITLPLASSPHAFSILSGIMLILMLSAIWAFVWYRKRY